MTDNLLTSRRRQRLWIILSLATDVLTTIYANRWASRCLKTFPFRRKSSVNNALKACVPWNMNTTTIREEKIEKKILLKIPKAFSFPTQQLLEKVCSLFRSCSHFFFFCHQKYSEMRILAIHIANCLLLPPVEHFSHFALVRLLYIDRKTIKMEMMPTLSFIVTSECPWSQSEASLQQVWHVWIDGVSLFMLLLPLLAEAISPKQICFLHHQMKHSADPIFTSTYFYNKQTRLNPRHFTDFHISTTAISICRRKKKHLKAFDNIQSFFFGEWKTQTRMND